MCNCCNSVNYGNKIFLDNNIRQFWNWRINLIDISISTTNQHLSSFKFDVNEELLKFKVTFVCRNSEKPSVLTLYPLSPLTSLIFVRFPTLAPWSWYGSTGRGSWLPGWGPWRCTSRGTPGSVWWGRTSSSSMWLSPTLGPTPASWTRTIWHPWLFLIVFRYWVGRGSQSRITFSESWAPSIS